jgi:gluconolactonase
MARMDVPVILPEAKFTTLADRYDGKRFNSPNDAVFNSKGELFFTDPPYGLAQQENDPSKELDYQGVFRVDTSGTVHLLTDELTRPNGLAFSPDESKLYVANSDPERAIWMVYDMQEDGSLVNGKVFYDATDKVAREKGLPDGMKVDDAGNIYATGPGGVWVFSPEGEQIGLVRTGQATSNCAFNADKSILYITADMYIMRLSLK